MSDPNPTGSREAARIQYVAADNCHRESCLALAEAQAITVRNPHEATVVGEAKRILQASRQHRTEAADNLTRSEEETEDTQQRAIAHSRMSIQLSIRALMLLSTIPETRSAQHKLDFYLPAHRGDQRLKVDAAGNITLSHTTTAFGTNRSERLPSPPRRIALMDAAVNLLVQTTRNWSFSVAHAAHFHREFLDHAQHGDAISETEVTAWVNRRIFPTGFRETASGHIG